MRLCKTENVAQQMNELDPDHVSGVCQLFSSFLQSYITVSSLKSLQFSQCWMNWWKIA